MPWRTRKHKKAQHILNILGIPRRLVRHPMLERLCNINEQRFRRPLDVRRAASDRLLKGGSLPRNRESIAPWTKGAAGRHASSPQAYSSSSSSSPSSPLSSTASPTRSFSSYS
eukprot:scaffold259919_cov31-Tisochrysis_lutea.AAC.11